MNNPTSYTRIALIAGVQAEQDTFRADLPRTPRSVSGLTVNEVVIHKPRSATVYCATAGIGKVNAALAASLLINAFQPDLVAIIGTAGNISTMGASPVLPIGAYLLTEAVHADYGAYRDGEFVPYRSGSLPIGPSTNTPFVSTVAAVAIVADPALPTARIATGDSFVEDSERSRALALSSGAGLVDMETGAVAQTAERLSLPWLGVKAVSDDANQDSATDFPARLAFAARQAAELFEQVTGLG